MENILVLVVASGMFTLRLTFVLTVLDWAHRDATQWGKSPFLVFIAIVFFFPWGLIAWLIFRPDPIDPSGGGFNLTDHRAQ